MGLGLQGHGALYDLLRFGDFEEIRVFDGRPDLEGSLKSFNFKNTKLVPISGFVTDKNLLEKSMFGVDIAICLLPRVFALPMAELAVEMGVNYACASYMGEFYSDDESRIRQTQRLDKLNKDAVKKNVVVLTQCGLDPGLDLLLAGEAIRQFDKVEDFISYGAGFPDFKAANNPLHYKFTWTIEGVMRSYYRPARIIKNGNIVDIAPNEIFFDENIHTLLLDELDAKLECFPNGDSVALAEELGIKDQVNCMGRYVCRWDGHSAFWRVMANCGFLNDETINVKGTQVNKISYLTALMSSEPQFFYHDNEQDVTLTRVDIKGIQHGKTVREIYQIIDKKDLQSGFTSMTRTVGFVVSIGALMALSGELGKGGMLSPIEMPFEKTSEELKKRGIIITNEKFSLISNNN